MSDPLIVDPGFLYGVKVVDIGDLRVSQGLSRRPLSACNHTNLDYDSKERRIWCEDCEHDVEAFDVFLQIVGYFHAAISDIKKRRERLASAEKFQARSLAVKSLDKVWRSRTIVPACPHCNRGLLPEDYKFGVERVGKEFEIARRRKKGGAA